ARRRPRRPARAPWRRAPCRPSSSRSTELRERRSMHRIVQHLLDAAWEDERRRDPEALVERLAADLEALRAQLGDRLVEVVAHERELVLRLALGRMNRELCGREREDQPAAVRV